MGSEQKRFDWLTGPFVKELLKFENDYKDILDKRSRLRCLAASALYIIEDEGLENLSPDDRYALKWAYRTGRVDLEEILIADVKYLVENNGHKEAQKKHRRAYQRALEDEKILPEKTAIKTCGNYER